jgi:hypothetical protein
MTPQDEAAEIFTRLFESLARRSGKTLNERGRADVRRACELLSQAGQSFEDLLDDLPPPPRRSEYTTVNFEVPPEVDRWRERRER